MELWITISNQIYSVAMKFSFCFWIIRFGHTLNILEAMIFAAIFCVQLSQKSKILMLVGFPNMEIVQKTSF